MFQIISKISLIALSVGLTSCGVMPPSSQPYNTPAPSGDGPPPEPVDLSTLVDATPVATEKSRYGNPKSYKAVGVRYFTMDSAENYKERGVASWYGKKFAGRRTSSGEIYDPYEMTAAHARLPIPSYVEVKNLENGEVTIVKVNDRGPFSRHRLIDLSYAAAVKLGLDKTGTARVEIRTVEPEPIQPVVQVQQESPSPNNISANGDGVYLQLGAFSSKSNAERLVQNVSSSQFSNTYLISTTRNGKTLYKVRIGPYVDKDTAESAASDLARAGYESKLVKE